mmetsp:Transcript_20099/g.59915  ORF Transcript_20099/g.59915 Transcript_20099/m.59915 type:complete len:505 (+) Transcript_20099:232-1746(+)
MRAESPPPSESLFRAARASRVLAGRGSVFRDRAEYEHAAAADGALREHDAAAYGALRVAEDEDLGDRADALYELSEPCDRVDAFVSHAWCDDGFAKYLALCLRTSLGLAVKASLIAWVGLVAVLFRARGFAAYGDAPGLKFLFVGVCGTTFAVTFLYGHALGGFGRGRETWWVDKLCIHQTRHDLKACAICALPHFLSRSDRLIVLHSERYFERLWCAYEVSTFLAERPAAAVDVVPLWLAPWLLATMCLDLVCSLVRTHLGDAFVPRWVDAWGPARGFLAASGLVCVAYSPAAVLITLGFRARARARAAAFDALGAFSFARAECGADADRARIEHQVAAAHGSVGAFEERVRTELRDRVRCETEKGTPFTLAALPFLPLCWAAGAEVFVNDGNEVVNFGRGERIYALATLLMWAHCIVCSWSVFPFIFGTLATTERARRRWVRYVGGALVVLIGYGAWGLASGIGTALVFVALGVDGGAGPRVLMALWFVGLARWNVYLFRGR